MATALLSAMTKIPVHRDIAMTGEITLRGKVLPVGGVKDKILAAARAGLTRIILPADNERDLEDIPPDVREKMEFHLVESMDDVILGRTRRHDRSIRGEGQAAGTGESPFELAQLISCQS